MRGMKGEIGDGIPEDLGLVPRGPAPPRPDVRPAPAHWLPMVQPSSMGIACYLAGRVAHDCARLLRSALLTGQTKRQQLWAMRSLGVR